MQSDSSRLHRASSLKIKDLELIGQAEQLEIARLLNICVEHSHEHSVVISSTEKGIRVEVKDGSVGHLVHGKTIGRALYYAACWLLNQTAERFE